MIPRLILASASPARLQTLRHAGLEPEVIVSGVDEEAISAQPPADLAATLAKLKASTVFAALPDAEDVLVIGCDSVLELDGEAFGKPGTPEVAIERWQLMRGRSGVLHTGHHLVLSRGEEILAQTRTGSTTVHFADLSDAEIEAYVATGEPLWVAGSFTLDGLGGAYVRGIEGDPHNVVGISLPLLREMLLEWSVPWHSLISVGER